MPPSGRWKRWSGVVVTNWPMKLTALALAAVLWVAVAAEEPATEKVAISLRLLTPEGRSLAGPVPAVSGVFAGSARELLKLYASPPVIHLAVPDTADSVYTVPLSIAQIELGKHVDARAQAIEPRVISIALSRPMSPVAPEVAARGDSVSERVLMGIPVTIVGERGGWSSAPPAVIVTVRGPTARLSHLTRDSVDVTAAPEGSGRRETVRLKAQAPPGIEAVATPDTAVVQRRNGA